MAERPTCATCVHFELMEPTLGRCRRFPPTVMLTPQRDWKGNMIPAPASFFPPIKSAEIGCGEHRDSGRVNAFGDDASGGYLHPGVCPVCNSPFTADLDRIEHQKRHGGLD